MYPSDFMLFDYNNIIKQRYTKHLEGNYRNSQFYSQNETKILIIFTYC